MSDQFSVSAHSGDGIILPKGWRITPRLMAGWQLDADHVLEIFPAAYDGTGRVRWTYRLSRNNTTIFEGEDFSSPVGQKITTDALVKAATGLLTFLTLQPGDVEADYFAPYTSDQIDWRDQYAEELSLLSMDDLCGYCGSDDHLSAGCPRL